MPSSSGGLGGRHKQLRPLSLGGGDRRGILVGDLQLDVRYKKMRIAFELENQLTCFCL